LRLFGRDYALSRKLKPEPKLSVAKRQPPKWQRERNITLAIWIIIPLVIALALGMVGYWGYDTYVAVWHKPVAKVNDTVLDMAYFVRMLRLYTLSSGQEIDSPTIAYQLLIQLENDELVKQKTPEMGIEVTEDEITQRIRSYLAPDGGNSGGNSTGNTTPSDADIEKMYHDLLDNLRFSDSEYREVVRAGILRLKLTEYLKENNVPTEAEQVHLHVIMVETEQKANETIDRLREGEDFATLAQELSIDEASKQAGGDLGWFPRGILYDQLEEAAFNLDIGNVSEPIPSSSGYYVIMVSEKAQDMQIEDDYREILAQKELENWTEEQRDGATIIEYLDNAKIEWAIKRI
jgi:parvulin-like peptidyl-prolyl isomerase